MNVREIQDCMNVVPREQRIKNRKKFLYFAIIAGCIVFFGTIASVIFKQQKREKAVDLVVSEHYSLICDGVEKKFTALEFLSLTSKDLADYDRFRFDEASKTIYCYRPIADVSIFIIVMSVPVIFGGILILFYTEAMERPLENDEKRESAENEKG